MKGARASMQDVEIVDVDTGADASVLGATPEDPAAEAGRAERAARRRRRLRRWWPVPALAVAALVGTQALLEARERALVSARQQVEGVLRTVQPGLEPTRQLSAEAAPVVLSGVAFGDLRIGAGSIPWEGPRELVAVDPAGETAWRASLEAGGSWDAGDPGRGAEYPVCLSGGEPLVVDCLVLDRDATGSTTPEDGSWVPGPPRAARLVSLDPATGDRLGERTTVPLSSWGGDDRLQVIASVAGDALTVTAWRPGSALVGDPLWATGAQIDTASLAPGAGVYPPGVSVTRGHVLVQGDLGSWAFAAADGRLEGSGPDLLTLTRSGHLTQSGVPVRVLDRDGSVLATLPGTPLPLTADDGSEPDLDLVVTPPDSSDGRALVAYDVQADEARWSLPRPLWLDTGSVLLDGVLYGNDREAVWAVDVATGRELWRTPAQVLTESGGVLTDGRHLLAVVSTADLQTSGVTVEPAAGQEPGPPSASSRAVVAYSLATGALVWATRLPDEVEGVWGWQGDLLGFGPQDVLVLN